MNTEFWSVNLRVRDLGADKGKVVPVLFLSEHHAMKPYWGSGGITPRIL
jgi:hypothetical protein